MMDTDEKLTGAIFEFGRIIREKIISVNFSHSLSHGQIQTLKFIELNEDRTMKEISSFLRVRPPTATSIINGLVKSGELKRTSDKKDRRIIKIELTEKGKKILRENFGQVAKELRKLFSKLNKEEKNNFIKILEKLKR